MVSFRACNNVCFLFVLVICKGYSVVKEKINLRNIVQLTLIYL